MPQSVVSPLVENLGTTVVAVGALGTAAFGIVEASKWIGFVGEAGLGSALRVLGRLTDALEVAYGPAYADVLRGQYRGDQRTLVRTLRQGVRVGLNARTAPDIAAFLGSIDGAALAAAVTTAERHGELTPAERGIIGRYELAADARIDAALAIAQSRYVGTVRVLSSLVAIGIALGVGYAMEIPAATAVLVGVAAVPLAPIAKDVASGIQAASKAMRGKA